MEWRKKWKPKTRGGHEVLFAAQCPKNKVWYGVFKENCGLHPTNWNMRGSYMLDDKEHSLDLIPVETEVYEFECEWNGNGVAVFGTEAKYIRTIDKLKGKRTRVRAEIIDDEEQGE